jgi:hypothetical protein
MMLHKLRLQYFNKPGVLLAIIILIIPCLNSYSQELYPIKLPDGLWHNEQRELRYRPDGEDFVITNGNRLFTRALYGTNTAFRVETGDRPEFALYMPGMGGNFKLGLESNGNSKWLTEANKITARYRAGSRLYTIEDPMLGNGKLTLVIQAMADADGFILKARFDDLGKPVNLICAFGGASGKKFSRDGDMGTDPESVFYLNSINCRDNIYSISNGQFTLKYGTGLQVGQDGRYFTEDLNQPSKISKEQVLTGTFPAEVSLKLADATKQISPLEFYQSSIDKAPALAGQMKVSSGTDYYFAIHNPETKPAFNYADAPGLFMKAEANRKLIADRVKINTPDPYINTLGGALAIASDAVWEAPSYLHGAIGWRMRLNGWRGAYTADALGWHDRAKMHLESYARSQVTIPTTGPIIADTAHHLARSLEKLGVGMFTSGYISRDPLGKNLRAHHYDMNLVFIDQLLRHFAWTGDTGFLKDAWPVLTRHLEWEKRNFDSDNNGLFDAYASIWASDALQYSGGSVTHSSAYNYYAFKKAAEIATILGKDPTSYRKESGKILNAMNTILWMPGKGSYAEFKDALGNRLLHPSAALWTVYHSMDSETQDPFMAYQSMRFIDTEIPHIPVRANGLEDKGYYTLSTTSWMPYVWSLNDVALAESMHTALANWQAGRPDEAFKLFKSEVLSFMYLGGSPGNIGQISFYSGKERYRDFADPIGMFSRALGEGLFGVVPDALNKTFTIRPGIPSDWNYASFSSPDISFDFKRNGKTDRYIIVPKFPTRLNLTFHLFARGQVKSIIVNGKQADWKNIPSSVGKPVIEISEPASDNYNIAVSWEGSIPVLPSIEKVYQPGGLLSENLNGATILKVFDPQQVLNDIKIGSSGFTAMVNNVKGSHTAFVQLSQGDLSWWMPVCFRIDDAVTLVPSNDNAPGKHSFCLQNNISEELLVSVTLNTFTTSVKIPGGKTSDPIHVPESELITGTNPVKISLQGGITIIANFIDWTANTLKKLEIIDMSGYFNDKVTQIFRNKYLSPRPQVTTLQLPWQGAGDWAGSLITYNIDDSGLRKRAGEKNRIDLPLGISFSTPGSEGKYNILFTSQWDNYPKEYSIPISGQASHAWFLMAGSTNPMQSQLDNGVLVVEYTDGRKDSLTLRNPETWWPVQEDYFTDGYAFALRHPRPVRIHLKTGAIIIPDDKSNAIYNGKKIDGGAATVLDLPLDPSKTLKQITLRAIANDVVLGLMGITLSR